MKSQLIRPFKDHRHDQAFHPPELFRHIVITDAVFKCENEKMCFFQMWNVLIANKIVERCAEEANVDVAEDMNFGVLPTGKAPRYIRGDPNEPRNASAEK